MTISFNREPEVSAPILGPRLLRGTAISRGSASPFVCFVAFCFFCTSLASAAEPFPIAVVNLDRIFKSYQPFQHQLEPLKAEAKQTDETIQVRQAELETTAAQLRQTQPSTPEFLRLQQQAVKLQTEFQQFVNSERQKLQQKEAAVTLAFYREVNSHITAYAKTHGLRLVLRQYDYSLEDNQPVADILKTLNRNILYDEGLDITDEILKALGSSSEKPDRRER